MQFVGTTYFVGPCWKPDKCSGPSSLPTSCQSGVFKAQTLSTHPPANSRGSSALRMKSQVIAKSFLGAPLAPLATSPTPPGFRHLGLPSVLHTCQAHSCLWAFGRVVLSARSTLSVPGSSLSSPHFQLKCQLLRDTFPNPRGGLLRPQSSFPLRPSSPSVT